MAREDTTTRRAWDLAARKYEPEIENHVRFLRGGGTSLLDVEREFLGDLSSWCGRAIHLQCSHGLDTLSLVNLGAGGVVGLDASEPMLEQARQKAERLAAPAAWVRSDVLDAPHELDGTADLVYTGKGALPWIADLEQWAGVVARLLKGDGVLYVVEGHPLDWVWDTQAPEYVLRPDAGDYFAAGLRPNRDFPASAVTRAVGEGEPVPDAMERQWTLGAILTRVAEAGLRIERVAEHPEPYWPRYPQMPARVIRRLPHTFSLLARKTSP